MLFGRRRLSPRAARDCDLSDWLDYFACDMVDMRLVFELLMLGNAVHGFG